MDNSDADYSDEELHIDASSMTTTAMADSHSDFNYQLPNPIQVPKSRRFVASVYFANVFPTITSHKRSLYIQEISTANVSRNCKHGLHAGQKHDGTT